MESFILTILVMLPGVWSKDWGVTFKDKCALNGTSVVIKCNYHYPDDLSVTAVGWFKKVPYIFGKWRLLQLSDLSSSPDHFRYLGNTWNDCSLEINDVQKSDEGPYYFSFGTASYRWRSITSAYLSVKELTAIVQPSTVREGGIVHLMYVSGCPTHVNIVWFKDGQPVPNPVFRARREDAGKYYCALLGHETVRSAPVALDVQYHPENISILMTPLDVVEGGGVNLTCSSAAANPAADSYTWYKRTTSNNSVLQVGSGQVLSIPPLEKSHTGLYFCSATNLMGGNNSTEVLLAMTERNDSQAALILAGVSVCVTLVLALLLTRWRQRIQQEKDICTTFQSVIDFRLNKRGSSSSATENSDYVNIQMLPLSLPPVTNTTSHSHRSLTHEHDLNTPSSSEDEVTYTTVTIKPRNQHLSNHRNNRGPQGSKSKGEERCYSVIYATVVKSTD